MPKQWIAAGVLALGVLAPMTHAIGQTPQRTTQAAMEVLATVNKKVPGTQDSAMRRCQGYMADAESAEKLGAKDQAARNWEKAARGCKQEANIACRAQKWAAPTGQCQELSR